MHADERVAPDIYGGVTQSLHSVDYSARLLKRLYLVERETMRALGARQIAVANWELKAATPQHLWHDSMHSNALRERVLELHYPRARRRGRTRPGTDHASRLLDAGRD